MLTTFLPNQSNGEESSPVIYSPLSGPILFSALVEQQLGLVLAWQPWRSRNIQLKQNGTLTVRKPTRNNKLSAVYDVSKVLITHMNFNSSETSNALNEFSKESREVGILLQLKTVQTDIRFPPIDTQIRMILPEKERELFFSHLRIVSKEHNLDNIRQISLTQHIPTETRRLALRLISSKASPMRMTIASAMDKLDLQSKKQHIIKKRGALKWLPVLFSNDLVHGSWWFVVGSLLFAITSAIILDNSYNKELGDDDSFLTPIKYRASWLLLTISGVFCTLGSMAFVRAVHEDPPMKPLFGCLYHLQSDELLGSWLFFLAALPSIPYCLIFLLASPHNIVYLGVFVASCIFVIGTYLFVRACYPSDKPRMKLIQPFMRCLCYCFCSRSSLRKHFANDWLAACWIIFWGTAISLLVCLLLLFAVLKEKNSLLIFIYGTGALETLLFLIGSAYFVAGSYPDEDGVAAEKEEDDEEEEQEEQERKQSAAMEVRSSSSSNHEQTSFPIQNTPSQGRSASGNSVSWLTWIIGSPNNVSSRKKAQSPDTSKSNILLRKPLIEANDGV